MRSKPRQQSDCSCGYMEEISTIRQAWMVRCRMAGPSEVALNAGSGAGRPSRFDRMAKAVTALSTFR